MDLFRLPMGLGVLPIDLCRQPMDPGLGSMGQNLWTSSFEVHQWQLVNLLGSSGLLQPKNCQDLPEVRSLRLKTSLWLICMTCTKVSFTEGSPKLLTTVEWIHTLNFACLDMNGWMSLPQFLLVWIL